MPFRLSKGARKWFRDLEDGFDLISIYTISALIDIYYLCLMAGLATILVRTGKKECTDYSST